mgnify:CR=1 FL=1|jgi:hypothetical protein
MFTSLSTVGFGDLAPRSDLERVFITITILFGELIFQYFLGILSEILVDFNSLHASFDDTYNLAKFFGLIENYNLGKQMKSDQRQKIEDFFAYKWAMDKNNAVGEQDLDMLQQLPQEVQVRIFTDFLFMKFLSKYKKFFVFPNLQSKNRHSYYNWQNQDYQNFMVFFLRILEPIQLKKGMILIKEMDQVNMTYFLMDGQIDVGYEVNLKKFYKIRYRGYF